MPRRRRFSEAGHVYHVLNRATQRLVLFESPGDYRAFEQLLLKARGRVGMRILAYCLMPNHWHLLLWPLRTNDLSHFVQWLTSTHASRWNEAHDTVGRGAVYQSRFKSIPVQHGNHLWWAWRYVERNALRANLVRRAEDWSWGSLHKRLTQHEWLDPGPVTLPADWTEWVNIPQTVEETGAFRRCVANGTPYGSDGWLGNAWRRRRGRPDLRKTLKGV
jgi:putative transposase